MQFSKNEAIVYLTLLIFALLNLNKSVLDCILTYFLSNYSSFDGQCSVAMATLAYEIYSETTYFAAQV